MSDSFPDRFAVEIDHGTLSRYLRATALKAWVLGLGICGLAIGILWCTNVTIETLLHGGWPDFLPKCIMVLIKCTLIPAFLGAVMYFLFSYRRLGRRAASLAVAVEGPFIRITEAAGTTFDQKIPFRSIAKYDVVQTNRMRRYDIGKLLLMLDVAAHNFSPVIEIYGIKDYNRIRDMLADIGIARGCKTAEPPSAGNVAKSAAPENLRWRERIDAT